jgi:hypothetical protein
MVAGKKTKSSKHLMGPPPPSRPVTPSGLVSSASGTSSTVTGKPKSHGFDAIMVVVDTLGKRAHFIPTHTTVTTEGMASLFLKEVWKHHRTPLNVVSDCGPQFVAEFTCELYRLLGIKLATSTAYHPQTDGQTE